MADTRVQLEVEDWVRREWLPKKYGQRFSRERVKLTSGGVFDFDAVSEDAKIVVAISTSEARTARGKYAVGKVQKIRSDLYFLMLTACERRIVALTDREMLREWEKELEGGRVPDSIEFVYVELPASLAERLRRARKAASDELTRD